MQHIDTSSRTEQRKFGLVMGAAVAVLGTVHWWWHGFAGFPTVWYSVAAALAVLGLVLPRVLQPFFVGWLKFAVVVNFIMTRLLLALAFYLLFTPTALILRVRGHDPLKRAWLPDADTYWEPAEEQPADFERYRNMY